MGKHLILDLRCEDKKLMEDKKKISNILNKCVKLVDMNKLTEPKIVDGADYDAGVTGFVVIETSHIAIHTHSDRKKINMDLYSCKDFNPNIVREFVVEQFNAEIINCAVLVRYDD